MDRRQRCNVSTKSIIIILIYNLHDFFLPNVIMFLKNIYDNNNNSNVYCDCQTCNGVLKNMCVKLFNNVNI